MDLRFLQYQKRVQKRLGYLSSLQYAKSLINKHIKSVLNFLYDFLLTSHDEPEIYYVITQRDGTSSVAVQTAGVCALIVGAGIRGKGRQIVDNIWKVLSTTTTKISNNHDKNGISPQYGYGLINAKDAVDKVLSGWY